MSDTWQSQLTPVVESAPTAPPSWQSQLTLVPSAQQKAVISSDSNGEEAARALKIGKQTGIPATVVQGDLPGYDAHARQQSAIQAVQNPAIAKYIDSNEMAPSVSSDDYSVLGKISHYFSGLRNEALDHATTLNLTQRVPGFSDLTASEPGREKMRGYMERMKSGFLGGFGEQSEVERMLSEARDLGLTQQTIDFWEGAGLLPAARAIEGGIRLVPGIIGGAVGLVSGLVAEGTGSEAQADRLLRDAQGINAALMGTAVSPLARAPKFAPVDPLHNFLAEHTPGGPRAKALSASETPPDQLWQAKPIIDQAKAESAGAALDSAIEAAKESKTAERSPELFENYIEAHGVTGTVSIPAQSILDIYKREGKIPILGDGLFGDIPGIADKAILAAETGADVKIPLKKYITIAKDNEQLHTSLKDELRVNEAPSKLEAKTALEETQQDNSFANLAPPQEGTVRMYHGGDEPTAGGPRWVTPSYQYARDFRRGELPNEVHYVDVPEKTFGYDEINNIYRHVEIPEEFAKQLKPVNQVGNDPVARATVRTIAKAKESLYLQPLFKDAETLNITAPEFKRYSDQIDRAEEQVLSRAVELARRETTRRLTPEWKANEATTRQNVAAEMFDRPDFAADRFFNQGLNSAGEKLRPELRVKLGDPGVLADEWAPAFGFASGSDMVMAVLKLEQERADTGKGPKAQFDQHVAAETARQMETRYGNLADNIALEASETALSNWNADLLATEWKMLADLNGVKPPVGREDITAWAREQFNKSTAGDVSYETWRRAAEKSGREAEKAFLKKDVKEAFIQKQKQMLNFLLAREAKDFEKEVARNENLMSKYAADVNLPKVDQAFTDQVHRLLQQVGWETRRTVENTDYNLSRPLPDGRPNTLSNFIDYQNQNGSKVVEAALPRKPLNEFTVDEYRDFATMLKSMDHNGRALKQIEVHGKLEDYNATIDKIAKNLDDLEKSNFDPDAKGFVSGLRMAGRSVDSRLIKAEKVIDWIDHTDPLGAFNSVWRPLIEGEQAKGDMLTKLAKMAKELPGDRAWGKALNQATTNKELRVWETGKLMQLSNENKIAIALNYGNKSNRRVMLEAMHWTEAEVETYLARELTAMDKKMVDGIHGLFEPLAPLVEKATSSRAGVAVPLIEGTPFLGMKGGYYPLISDPRAKLLGQQVETDLFQKTKFDPLPTAPALKQRTGKIYPVDLSLNNINSILSRTTHAVFMQDPVINFNKVIANPIIREGIANGFGPEYVKLFDKYIRDIADNGGSDVGFHDDMAAWLSRNLRQNVTTMLMGWKASTALIHGGSAGASSVYESFKLHMPDENAGKAMVLAPVRLVENMRKLGLGQFLPEAAQRFFGSQTNMFDTINFVFESSGEMRNRQRSLQKDFGFQLDKILNTTTLDDLAVLRNLHQNYAMALVGYLDMLTATPVWKATYDKAIVDGVEHADAVYIADKAVREAHGSASLVSRANIGRGEINKWLTIAYNGYWNHNYNKMREAGKEVAFGEGLSVAQRTAIGAGFATAMIVAPALVHHAVRGEESETWEGAIAGMIASQFGGTVPLVNSITYGMIHNRDPSISPLDEILKTAANIGRDQLAKNPKHTEKHLAQALGYFTGLPPTNQAIDAFTFLNDVLHDRQDPETVQEWARGLMTGKAQPKAHR